MRKIKNILFSMELTGILIMMFAIAIGFATFIENDFGTIAAKSRIYNAKWFEFLLLLLVINMTGSIIKHKMYLRKKWTILLFHVSFLVIFVGAAATRYIGYEGMMRIREGETSNQMITDETYIRIWAEDGNLPYYKEKKVLATAESVGNFSYKFLLGEKKVRIDVVDYYSNAGETLIEGEGEEMLWLVLSNETLGRKDIYFQNGEIKSFGEYKIGFNTEPVEGGININLQGSDLTFIAPDSVGYMNMMAGVNVTLLPDSVHQLQQMALYSFGSISLVVKKFYESARIGLISTDGQDGMSSIDAFTARVKVGDITHDVNVFGGKGYTSNPGEVNLEGINIKISYGAKKIELPFALQLKDFQMERYPGSNSPSSYASQVVVIDESRNLEMPYRIYMNNVLNYRGYRFFQSSYDRDELGTILSVNHDSVGTILTYIGYLLMTIGMFFTIFAGSSRFRTLFRLSSKVRESRKTAVSVLLVIGFVLFGSSSYKANCQTGIDKIPEISKEHAAKFGKLLVQDVGGRIKPVNTLASEVLRKIARKTSFEGQNPEQVFLGILAFPGIWETVPFIKIGHPEVNN
ncbi:MAG: cytochrome c biogenesis protein ResB, partial [Bacteroidales bacterium]|nr:cytochrome c biogenesis protein ResB [Bacteroidales bacterium]